LKLRTSLQIRSLMNESSQVHGQCCYSTWNLRQATNKFIIDNSQGQIASYLTNSFFHLTNMLGT
jgi:hypothetical protein